MTDQPITEQTSADLPNDEVALKREIYETRREIIERIDELDTQIRRQVNPDRIAAQYPAKLSAGAAALGFLVALKAPKKLFLVAAVGAGIVLYQKYQNDPELRFQLEMKRRELEAKARELEQKARDLKRGAQTAVAELRNDY